MLQEVWLVRVPSALLPLCSHWERWPPTQGFSCVFPAWPITLSLLQRIQTQTPGLKYLLQVVMLLDHPELRTFYPVVGEKVLWLRALVALPEDRGAGSHLTLPVPLTFPGLNSGPSSSACDG